MSVAHAPRSDGRVVEALPLDVVSPNSIAGVHSSLRIDDDLYAAAKQAGAVAGRSAAQQIAHWAVLGREVDRSHNVSAREVADVLAGVKTYD